MNSHAFCGRKDGEAYGYLGVSAPDYFAACCYHTQFTVGVRVRYGLSIVEWGLGRMRAYLTLHSIIVPLLSTPNCVYMGFCGFCVWG